MEKQKQQQETKNKNKKKQKEKKENSQLSVETLNQGIQVTYSSLVLWR